MAHCAELSRPDCRRPQTDQEQLTWRNVARVFGRPPSSIRCLAPASGGPDAWVVKVSWAWCSEFEFICSGGVLVGIPKDLGK